MVNVEPRPGVLATVTSPPSIWQKRRVMVRPSPVPPYLRVVEESAWVNGWNSLPICSAVMPMPSSVTRKSTQPAPSPGSRATSRVIVPLRVNLVAFDSRFKRAWRTLAWSLHIVPRSPGRLTTIALPLFSASGWIVLRTPWTSSAMANGSKKRSILPASIFDRSRTSLIRPSRCLPEAWILARSATNSGRSRSSASSRSISL